MVRYQQIKPVNAVNEITQPAISFTLFGTLVIFGIPLYDLLQARQGPQMRYCLWAPECVETPLIATQTKFRLCRLRRRKFGASVNEHMPSETRLRLRHWQWTSTHAAPRRCYVDAALRSHRLDRRRKTSAQPSSP